jgi:hypothetical protein
VFFFQTFFGGKKNRLIRPKEQQKNLSANLSLFFFRVRLVKNMLRLSLDERDYDQDLLSSSFCRYLAFFLSFQFSIFVAETTFLLIIFLSKQPEAAANFGLH